ncbi:hypothetical protein BJX76DRAFT_353268 [Aspergillus varians]
MTAIQLARPAIRHFSVHRSQTSTRTSRFIATSCLVSAVVVPFIPPALVNHTLPFVSMLVDSHRTFEIVHRNPSPKYDYNYPSALTTSDRPTFLI